MCDFSKVPLVTMQWGACFVAIVLLHRSRAVPGDLRRVVRQIPREINQGCRTTGYETRVRELCEEVLDNVCKVRTVNRIVFR